MLHKGLRDQLDDQLIDRIKRRLKKFIPILEGIGIEEFYVAGNFMNMSGPNDLDLFPVKKDDFCSLNLEDEMILARTKNAITIKSIMPIQLCRYHKESLEKLLESFDFSHIQVGAHITMPSYYQPGTFKIMNIDYTDAYIESLVLNTSIYTGSEYPLSSLIRMHKYMKRGNIRINQVAETIKILKNIYERGFDGYEDFKDQLDAVDLGMVPEDMKGLGKTNLLEFFELLNKGE